MAYLRGNLFALVLAVAEKPWPEQHAGALGDALGKSLERLGWGSAAYGVAVLKPGEEPILAGDALALLVEAFDPMTVVALDEASRVALCGAVRGAEGMMPYAPARALGRTFVAVDDFCLALGSTQDKQHVWSQLKFAAYTS